MKVLNVQQLIDAPQADLYLCAGRSFYQATPSKEQVVSFFGLVPDGVATLYREVKPDADEMSRMTHNAVAVLQVLGWVWNRESGMWVEPETPKITFEVKREGQKND